MLKQIINPCPECQHTTLSHTMEGCLNETQGKICPCEKTFRKSLQYKIRKRGMPLGIIYKKEAMYLAHLKGKLWY